MTDYVIVSFDNKHHIQKQPWMGNRTFYSFTDFNNNKSIRPLFICFESLTENEPYLANHPDKINKFINMLNERYKNDKNLLKEIFILENDLTDNDMTAIKNGLKQNGFDTNVRFFDAKSHLKEDEQKLPLFFQIGQKNSLSIFSYLNSRTPKIRDERIKIFNYIKKNWNTLTDEQINNNLSHKNKIPLDDLLTPETKLTEISGYAESFFDAIKTFKENISWITWLLTQNIFKKNTHEFSLLQDLSQNIIEIKNTFEETQKNYRENLVEKLEDKNTVKAVKKMLEDYLKNSNEENFNKIIKHEIYFSLNQNKEVLTNIKKLVKEHYNSIKQLPQNIEKSINLKRNELIRFVDNYLQENTGKVHSDKLIVMQLLSKHLKDPLNSEKKNALLQAINTNTNWGAHFFKSRTLESVQKAQELLVAEEKLHPKK